MVSGPYLSPPGFFVGDWSARFSANLKKCTKSVQFYTLFRKTPIYRDLRQTGHNTQRCKTLMYAIGRQNPVMIGVG